MFDIEIKTINCGMNSISIIINTVKGADRIRMLIVRAERLVEEVGKVSAFVIGGHFVVTSFIAIDTADAQKNFDTTIFAVRNSFLDSVALAEEV
ncbi:hypothetical protein SNK03_004888 [Fusarium graminearum]|nr:hypothetical protein HG531_005249 [Fusarium graminearum]CAF3482779.1 unnamed protein product [Fusarium graminearum]CAG1992008.1 unnamed protein product [Fusarium graminearum]VTO89114.1 unnamed protein product [Fusarium graminearum]